LPIGGVGVGWVQHWLADLAGLDFECLQDAATFFQKHAAMLLEGFAPMNLCFRLARTTVLESVEALS